MKYCGNCGAKLEDTAKFCAACGVKCPERTAYAPQNAKRKAKLLMIIGAVVILAVLVAGILAVRWYNSPEQQLLRAIDARDYTLAMSIISKNGTIDQSDRLLKKINARIVELQTAYEKEILEYETVCAELEEIEQLGIQNAAKQMESSRQIVYALYCERNLEVYYLCTSQVNFTAETNRISKTWDYDNQGRLTGYGVCAEYFYSETLDYSGALLYSYVDDVSRKIEKVIVESDEESGTLHAIYVDDLLVEYTGEINGEKGTIRFSYDENGNMISTEVVDDGDHAELIATMSYYGNGVLQERRDCDGFITIKRYDENGMQSEMIEQFGNGDYAYRYVYDYNEQGKMTYQAVYSGNDVEPYMITYREYDEVGRLIAMNVESDGHSYYALGEWDDFYQKVIFKFKNGSDETTIVQEYDEAGNLICSTNYSNGELQTQATYTYIALQLPLDYEKPDISNPQYLISIS